MAIVSGNAFRAVWLANKVHVSKYLSILCLCFVPSVHWHCWLGDRKGIRPVKTEWWGAGVAICLERGTDLHTAQLMPLPLTVSCFSKIQIGFTFLVTAHFGSPGKRVIICARVCVCMSMLVVVAEKQSTIYRRRRLRSRRCRSLQVQCHHHHRPRRHPPVPGHCGRSRPDTAASRASQTPSRDSRRGSSLHSWTGPAWSGSTASSTDRTINNNATVHCRLCPRHPYRSQSSVLFDNQSLRVVTSQLKRSSELSASSHLWGLFRLTGLQINPSNGGQLAHL